jgi:hypothetical protein
MWRCGFRSIRAWRWARRHGGFPEPAKATPQGPIWTERQIAEWLGEANSLDQTHYFRLQVDLSFRRPAYRHSATGPQRLEFPIGPPTAQPHIHGVPIVSPI